MTSDIFPAMFAIMWVICLAAASPKDKVLNLISGLLVFAVTSVVGKL